MSTSIARSETQVQIKVAQEIPDAGGRRLKYTKALLEAQAKSSVGGNSTISAKTSLSTSPTVTKSYETLRKPPCKPVASVPPKEAPENLPSFKSETSLVTGINEEDQKMSTSLDNLGGLKNILNLRMTKPNFGPDETDMPILNSCASSAPGKESLASQEENYTTGDRLPKGVFLKGTGMQQSALASMAAAITSSRINAKSPDTASPRKKSIEFSNTPTPLQDLPVYNETEVINANRLKTTQRQEQVILNSNPIISIPKKPVCLQNKGRSSPQNSQSINLVAKPATLLSQTREKLPTHAKGQTMTINSPTTQAVITPEQQVKILVNNTKSDFSFETQQTVKQVLPIKNELIASISPLAKVQTLSPSAKQVPPKQKHDIYSPEFENGKTMKFGTFDKNSDIIQSGNTGSDLIEKPAFNKSAKPVVEINLKELALNSIIPDSTISLPQKSEMKFVELKNQGDTEIISTSNKSSNIVFTSKFCVECGTKFSENAQRFCGECGAKRV
ncbi:hypothetical protein HK096_006052 [Nowakowskiella sp. JEL0078]|nr:hypothetical protein HK096_006052 [Nowakowskiella sp. JEL0078]